MGAIQAVRSIFRPVKQRAKTAAMRATEALLARRWDNRNWLRIRQINAWEEALKNMRPASALEISPGDWSPWKTLPNYRGASYPAFNVCTDQLAAKFDAVIADQILEHVTAPKDAVANMRAMTTAGGWTMIATPFLFRVHGRPMDFHRWTPDGLRLLMLEAGFAPDQIWIGSWGNAECVRAHTEGPVQPFGFGRPMHNDPEYPVMVWALARNSPLGTATPAPYAGAEH